MNIVTLRLYRGKETYSKTGKLTSENQLYKISHKTTDWANFKKTIAYTFSNAEVVAVNEQIVKMEEEEVLGKMTPVAIYSYKKVEITDELKKEVEAIFRTDEKPSTPEQVEIAKLKAKVDALMGKSPKKTKKTKPVQEIDPELKKVREEYYKAIGKKAYHAWDIKILRDKIANQTNNKS